MRREPCNCGVCEKRRAELAEKETANLKAVDFDTGGLYGTEETASVENNFVGFAETDPTKTQVGGTHYSRFVIQPGEFISKNNLGWFEGNVIKYVCRHPFKNGVEDIRKAIHYLQLILKWTYNTNA
jgi:hypothetical protein